jgi:LysM repeat protein
MRSKLSIAFCALLVLALPIMGGCGSAGGSTETVHVVVTPVPSPTLPPEAMPTLPPVTYTVKAGDTLSGIADLFGVTVDDIVRANNIADPNSLALGQVLTIPGRAPTPIVTFTPSGTITTTQIPITATITVTITATMVVTGTPTNVLPPPDVTPPLGPTAGTNAP